MPERTPEEIPELDLPAAAYLWQKAFSDLAATIKLSTPDALDLIGFPAPYLRQMGLEGDTIDAVAEQVDAATPEPEEETHA
jgi:hypothetical protein